jgi:hypothetical protein
MIGSLVTMMVLSAGGPAEALTAVQVKNLALKMPAAWKRSVEDGTSKFEDPSGNAWFLVDVGAVQTAGMSGTTCLGKITKSLGGQWKRLDVGGAPAATQSWVDKGQGAKALVEVETLSYVGCDGKTTWSIVMHLDPKQKSRFEALAQQVAQSVTYVRAGGK